MKYTDRYAGNFRYDSQGFPQLDITTTEFELDDFTQYFIHRLCEYLPSMEHTEDGVDRLYAFQKLYIQCMLDSKYEYTPDCYTPP